MTVGDSAFDSLCKTSGPIKATKIPVHKAALEDHHVEDWQLALEETRRLALSDSFTVKIPHAAGSDTGSIFPGPAHQLGPAHGAAYPERIQAKDMSKDLGFGQGPDIKAQQFTRSPAEGKQELRIPQQGAGSNERIYHGQKIYHGQWKGNVKHGKGTLEVKGGDHSYTYSGDFVDDMMHGFGILKWPDGREYRGQFSEDKFDGDAIFVWADGRRYVGQYGNDEKNGSGNLTWPDGRKYEGNWKDGKRDGKGVYVNAKGASWEGYWFQDRPNRTPEAQVRQKI